MPTFLNRGFLVIHAGDEIGVRAANWFVGVQGNQDRTSVFHLEGDDHGRALNGRGPVQGFWVVDDVTQPFKQASCDSMIKVGLVYGAALYHQVETGKSMVHQILWSLSQ